MRISGCGRPTHQSALAPVARASAPPKKERYIPPDPPTRLSPPTHMHRFEDPVPKDLVDAVLFEEPMDRKYDLPLCVPFDVPIDRKYDIPLCVPGVERLPRRPTRAGAPRGSGLPPKQVTSFSRARVFVVLPPLSHGAHRDHIAHHRYHRRRDAVLAAAEVLLQVPRRARPGGGHSDH